MTLSTLVRSSLVISSRDNDERLVVYSTLEYGGISINKLDGSFYFDFSDDNINIL